MNSLKKLRLNGSNVAKNNAVRDTSLEIVLNGIDCLANS